jgi:hypothetical protein
MTILFGGMGVAPTLRGQPTNVFSLNGGSARTVPAGTWHITPDLYSCIQELDGITGIWRAIGSGLDGGATNYINSDGNNFRVMNQSGCVVGGIVTTAGSGYTTAPTVTASAGSAILKAIVGGAVSTTVTISNAGTGYTYPPIITFDAPPAGGGVQATGHSTLSGSTVGSIVVDDQGAGYTATPNVYITNDPREGQNGVSQGSGATATAVLTGSGTVTAVLGLDCGSALTSLPTLAFSGTSTSGAAATAIMNWSVTGYTVTSVGGAYTAPLLVTSIDNGFTTTAGSTTNPTITTNLVRGRQARILGVVASSAVSATGQVVYDGGVFSGVPTLVAVGFASGTAAKLVATMGATQGVTLIQPV